MADLTVLSLFSGVGGKTLGFQRAGFRSVGAFDVDPLACAALEYMTGERATCADLGVISPQELRAACTGRPDVVALSPPCKSFSGCLPAAMATSEKYVELSSLSLRGIWLTLEAWPERPPSLIVLENVPRITTRGRHWLDQVTGLLHAYGYAVAETVHDAGELGGLAQRRRRFLMVARHMKQAPSFLRLPPMKPLRGVGDVLGLLPVPTPGSTDGGPMHRLPRMSVMNWIRLALIPAGGDWRDLPPAVALPRRDGRQNGGFGVNEWREPGHAVVAEGTVRNTWASTADPRITCAPRSGVYGVTGWGAVADTVLAAAGHDNGRSSIADPRVTCERREGSMGVTGWNQPSTAVIANGRHFNGPWQVADPRVQGSAHRHNGKYGVESWAEASHAIIAEARTGKGWAGVADPRVPELDGPPLDIESRRPCHLVIVAADGTWHRPMTTLELAALQGLPTKVGGAWLALPGNDAERRTLVGNCVPPPAAEAIARACAEALAAGGRFTLSSEGIWVRRPEVELRA